MITSLIESARAELLVRSASSDLASLSKDALRTVLAKVTTTAFGKIHGLSSRMTLDNFRATVPIRSYAEYDPWIQRARAGESDVLWPGRPLALVTTSGTTTRNKIIPITTEFLAQYHLGSRITFHRALKHCPGLLRGKLLILGGPSEEEWCGGIPVGSITGVLYSSLPEPLRSMLAVPPSVHNIRSYAEKIYVIARLALETPITGIITVIPGSLLVLLEEIAEHAQQLIEEIASGNLRRLATAPTGLETALKRRLRPNRTRAQELQRALLRDGTLLPKHIWPVQALCTYLKEGHPSQWASIRSSYGDLQMMDPGLVASEGRVSVGVLVGEPQSAVIPTASFVEFQAVDLTDLALPMATETLLPHELEVGRSYTPILSSPNGLLRYRLEDVIRVVEHRKGIPFIEFLGRLDGSLSAAGEKMTEAHFRAAISQLQMLGFAISGNWAAGVQWTADRPRYAFLWETTDPQDFAGPLEQILQDINTSYRRKRDQCLLAPVATRAVRIGRLPIERPEEYRFGQSKDSHLVELTEHFGQLMSS